MHRHFLVEEIGPQTAVDGIRSLSLGVKRLGWGAVISRGVHFEFVPKLCPDVHAQAVRPHLAFHVRSFVFCRIVGIIDVRIESDVEKARRTVHDVGFQARVVRLADVDRYRCPDPTVEEQAVVNVFGDSVDGALRISVISRQTYTSETFEKLGPAALNGVGVNRIKIHIAHVEAFLLIFHEIGEITRTRIADSARIAEPEVVHRLGPVRQMQRRTPVEI